MKIVKSLRIELEESDVQKALTEYIERHDPSIEVTEIKFGNRTLNITVEGELRPEKEVTNPVMPQNTSESDEYTKDDSDYIQVPSEPSTTDNAPAATEETTTSSVSRDDAEGVRDTELPTVDTSETAESAPAKRSIFNLPDTDVEAETPESVPPANRAIFDVPKPKTSAEAHYPQSAEEIAAEKENARLNSKPNIFSKLQNSI